MASSMCVLIRTQGYRQITSRRLHLNCTTNTIYIFRRPGFLSRISRQYLSLTSNGKCGGKEIAPEIQRTFDLKGRDRESSMENVVKILNTDQDFDVHQQICRKIIGKGGENIRKLKAEAGCDFNMHMTSSRRLGLLVRSRDAEGLNSVAEKIDKEIQIIRNHIDTVFTDEDVNIHKQICRHFMGKGKQNVKRLKLETGLDFEVSIKKAAGLLVLTTDAEVLKSATEKITQEVKKIRNRISGTVIEMNCDNMQPNCTETVLTNEDIDVHNQICRNLLGVGGQNIRRLKLESGLDFEVQTAKSAHLIVWAKDNEVLKDATEKITQRVQRIQDHIEKVLTDEDVDIHKQICKHFMGKGGENIRRLTFETGLDFEVQTTKSECLLVCAMDDEELKCATEKVSEEVKRIRNRILDTSFEISDDNMDPNLTETVFTDDNVDIHNQICGYILGKRGQNIRRLKSEVGFDFHIHPSKSGLLVYVTDAALLKSASEKVTEEVQRIKNLIELISSKNVKTHSHFTEIVFTDKNVDVHKQICGILIGRKGDNVKRLRFISGLDFEINCTKTALCVSAPDSVMLKKAVELIREEILLIKYSDRYLIHRTR